MGYDVAVYIMIAHIRMLAIDDNPESWPLIAGLIRMHAPDVPFAAQDRKCRENTNEKSMYLDEPGRRI